jgi:hypothetical protein
MNRIVFAALALLALPSAARAQGCVGAPVPEGRNALQLQGATSTFSTSPEIDGTGIGAALRGNPRGILGYSAEYSFARVGGDDSPLHSGGAMLSLRAPLGGSRVAVCARGGAMASRLNVSASATELDNLTFPVGIVLELPLAAGAGEVVPYVAPQYLFSSTSGQVLGLDYDESGNSIGVEAGVGVRVSRAAITLGGSFSDLPDGLLAPAVPRQSFFLRVGVLF